MIQVRNVSTNELYVINEVTLAYFEVGVYQRYNEDGSSIEVFYVEFFFNGERRLKFRVDAGLYDSKEDLEQNLIDCTRHSRNAILVSATI